MTVKRTCNMKEVEKKKNRENQKTALSTSSINQIKDVADVKAFLQELVMYMQGV